MNIPNFIKRRTNVLSPEVTSVAYFINSPNSNKTLQFQSLNLHYQNVISDKEAFSADVTVIENSSSAADVYDVPDVRWVYQRDPEIRKTERRSVIFFRQNCEPHALIQSFSRYLGSLVDYSPL
jgi:hypothetical protein